MTFEDRNSDDLANTKSGSKFSFGLIDTMTNLVLDQEHLGKEIFSGEENRVTGTFILFAGFDDILDEILREIRIGFARSAGEGASNRIGGIVTKNRTNILFVDLRVITAVTAITNEESTSKFLIEHSTHFLFEPSNDVKVSDIDHIITIHLLKFIDSGRKSGSLKSSNDFRDLLLSFDITTSTGFISSDVGGSGFNTGERRVFDTTHNNANPAGVASNEFGGLVNSLNFREKILDVRDSVGNERLFHRASFLGIFNSSKHFAVHKFSLIVGFVGSIKCIVFHFFILLCISIFFVFKRHTDHGVDNFLLFFAQSIEHVLNSFFIVTFISMFNLDFFLFFFIRHVFALLIIVGMFNIFDFGSNVESFTCIKYISVTVCVVTMRNINIHDSSTGISSRQNQTNFSNQTMNDISSSLFKLISINRQ